MSTLAVNPDSARDMSIIERLCDYPDLLSNVLAFLVPYEQFGLGRVSKKFKNACYRALGYDPFAGDRWMFLGMNDLSSSISEIRLNSL